MTPRVPKMTDAERVEVMLSVLPWLAAKGGAPLAEVAHNFDMDPEVLRADLMKVFYDVEPSTGADSMVEVDIDEDDSDFVSVRLPGSFGEPLDLTQAEALALLAAGRALVAERGSEVALVPALEKLVAILGPRAARALEVDLGGGDPRIREDLSAAIGARESIELHYFSWSSDEVGTRTVDPWALHSEQGHWYLTGWCTDRDALRHFRLDRMLGVRPTGLPLTHEAPTEIPRPTSGFSGEQRRVRLRVPTEAAWIVESYPHESFADDGDFVEVTLVVTHETWLDRLLLRLPARSTATDEQGTDLMGRRNEVARRILVRHGAQASDV